MRSDCSIPGKCPSCGEHTYCDTATDEYRKEGELLEAECARLREALEDLQEENEALLATVLGNFLAAPPGPEKEKS